MKNQSTFNPDVYAAPERPMEISGPALPRWTPPQPLEYYYRKSGGRAPEDISKPAFIPIYLHGTEAVGELFKYTVRVRSDIEVPSYPDLITLNLDDVVGTEVTVFIDVPGRGTFIPGMPGNTGQGNIGFYVREISGIVSDARFVRQDDRAMVYEFDIEPALKKATLGQNWRVFQNCTVIDAIRRLLDSYQISIDWRTQGPLHGTHYPTRDLQRQYWEDDWSCFKRWCERAGLFFWFEHSHGFHRLVIADHMGAFASHGEAYETLRYAPGDNRIDEEHIERLALSSRRTEGKATVVDHDYMQPRMRRANAPLRASEDNPRDTGDADQEFYEPANISQPLHGVQGLNGRPLDLDEQARQVALVRQQSMRCQGKRAKGSGHLRALIPGYTFNLTEYPLEKANQEYLVVSATLTIESNDQTSGTDQVFCCDTEFELYPVQAGHFRLPIVTPWPVAGTEIAIVTGPEGHEIWTDAVGRTLCQLVPDRAGKYDNNSFIWLRVTQPWQNGQMGSVFVPRIGSEILVGYVNGNPDMPYIAGSAVNARNLPGWELPHNQWVSGLRSRERGGTASNHLALDDTRGKQQAQLASDHAKSSLSLGYITRIDGNKGRQDERGQGFELRTDLWGALRAAMGLFVTTFGRSNAAGKVKEMGETIARLTQARGQHEDLSQVAQRHNAQTPDASQGDAISAIKAQNDAIRGNGGASGNTEDFPELTRPDMVFASAAGIATTAADSTHGEP